MKQTGADMKIGLDAASFAQSRIVNQIILIADDSRPFQKSCVEGIAEAG